MAAETLAASLEGMRCGGGSLKLHRLTEDGRSWLLHAPKWWPVESSEMQALWAHRPKELTLGVIMGREVAFPRRTRAYGQDYKYTGQTQAASSFDDAHPHVRQVVRALQQVDGLASHNAALLNWYDASLCEYMGPHSDDERALARGQPIISVSWCTNGHYRRFRFSPRPGCKHALTPSFSPHLPPGVVHLQNGCLLVMGGDCQRTHKHELMKPTKALGESDGYRINLTLRHFLTDASASSKRARESGKTISTHVSGELVSSKIIKLD